MKNLILSLIIVCCASFTFAAHKPFTDTITFDRYTFCEKKWVMLPKKDTATSFMFGYIYIDHQAGFTFDMKGSFKINADGKYVADTSVSKSSSIKYRIAPNWTHVSVLPPSRLKEMNLPTEPSWVSNYYKYTDTVAHNYRWGWIYNDVKQSDIALTYLLPAYKINPDFDGLEFEITYAYNELERYADAIKFMEPLLKKRPDDVMLYREMGYAYLEKGDPLKAIPYYKQGIEKCNDKQLNVKSEMAINLAVAYQKTGNEKEYKSWGTKAKSWATPDMQIYKSIVAKGF